MGRKKRVAHIVKAMSTPRSDATEEDAVAARPIDQGDAGDAEKLDGGIEECEGENSVAPSFHIVAIAIFEFDAGFALAIEISAPRPCRKCILAEKH